MNTAMQTSPSDNTATIRPIGYSSRQIGDKSEIGRKPMTRAELEEQDGIKAQHAVSRFVIKLLKQANTGWSGEETEVGGSEDRQGIDFYLINESEGRKILVDFSFASKGGYAVKLEHDWFERNADGTFTFLAQYTNALVRRFMPVMDPNFHVNFARQ
jgi:hypothetical protein